jgi:hypothetical protein
VVSPQKAVRRLHWITGSEKIVLAGTGRERMGEELGRMN